MTSDHARRCLRITLQVSYYKSSAIKSWLFKPHSQVLLPIFNVPYNIHDIVSLCSIQCIKLQLILIRVGDMRANLISPLPLAKFLGRTLTCIRKDLGKIEKAHPKCSSNITIYYTTKFIAERISARYWIADRGPEIGSCMYVCMYVCMSVMLLECN